MGARKETLIVFFFFTLFIMVNMNQGNSGSLMFSQTWLQDHVLDSSGSLLGQTSRGGAGVLQCLLADGVTLDRPLWGRPQHPRCWTVGCKFPSMFFFFQRDHLRYHCYLPMLHVMSFVQLLPGNKHKTPVDFRFQPSFFLCYTDSFCLGYTILWTDAKYTNNQQ